MTRWQRFLIALVGKITVHHGGGRSTRASALALIYSGMNAKQKKYRKAHGRALRSGVLPDPSDTAYAGIDSYTGPGFWQSTGHEPSGSKDSETRICTENMQVCDLECGNG